MTSDFATDLQTARTASSRPATSSLKWCATELTRVQCHVDDAYTALLADNHRAAKEALRAARWGTRTTTHKTQTGRQHEG